MHTTGFKTHQQIRRAQRRSDREAQSRMECLTFLGILVFGMAMGVALYDWTQDGAWAQTVVRFVYGVAPL